MKSKGIPGPSALLLGTIGSLPSRVFNLKILRRDRTMQGLPRTGGDSLDAIRSEWETVILHIIYRPGLESRALCAPPPDHATSLFIGLWDWYEAFAPAAHAASFSGLSLYRLV
jgi:hypothetical protein